MRLEAWIEVVWILSTIILLMSSPNAVDFNCVTVSKCNINSLLGINTNYQMYIV